MRLSRESAPQVALLAVAVLGAAGLVYLWQQAQSTSSDRADVDRRVTSMAEKAEDGLVQELEVELAQLQETPAPNPFPTRKDMVQRITGLRGMVEGSGAQLITPPTQSEFSATAGGTGTDTDKENQRTYPGVLLGLEAGGTPDALLSLLGNMQEQIPGLVLRTVLLVREEVAPEESLFRLTLTTELYYRPEAATSGAGG